MNQAQYSNIGGDESVWVNHTVRCCGRRTRRWASSGPDPRHRRHGRHDAGAAADLPGRERRAAPLDGQPRRRQARRHGARLQRRELDDEPGHPLRGPARRRSGRHAAADRDDDAARASRAARSSATAAAARAPLGRLQRDDARPERLRLLVHDRVLRDDGHELADAHRLVPAQPELRRRRRRRHRRARRSRSTRSRTRRTATPTSRSARRRRPACRCRSPRPDNCTVSGNVVHLTGAGSCTITASQAGDATYAPAPDMSQTFTIAKAVADDLVRGARGQDVRRPGLHGQRDGVVGPAGLVRGDGQLHRLGLTVHLTAAGSCTITASQAGQRELRRGRRRPAVVHHQSAAPPGTPLSISSSTEGTLSFSAGAWVNGGWHVKLTSANCVAGDRHGDGQRERCR